MAIFGSGKDKKESGFSELVLAYLEDAQRLKVPFLFKDGRKLDVTGVVQNIDENAGTFSVQMSIPFSGEKGMKSDFIFMAESMRLGGKAKVQEIRATTVVFTIPSELELMERRKHARARLNPKEGATATALTGLFEGIGLNGIIENISEFGCRIRVEKAMNIKDERRLPLGVALLQAGQPFMLIKLNKVPKCAAAMELSGKLAYISDAGGLAVGITFEKPRADFAGALRSLVSSRSSAIPTSVPAKVRRKAQAQESELLSSSVGEQRQTKSPAETSSVAPVPAPQAMQVEGPTPPPQEVVPEPSAKPAAVPSESPANGVSEPDASAPSRNTALMRLKKRSRGVAFIAPSAYSGLLKDYLLEEGYARVLMASNFHELLTLMLDPNVALVFIDTDQPVLECLEMISHIRNAHDDMPPVVLAAEDISRGLVLAAHNAGVAQLVVKPYALDEALSNTFEQVMGI